MPSSSSAVSASPVPISTGHSLAPPTSQLGPRRWGAPPRALSRPPRPPVTLTGVHLCPRRTTIAHRRRWDSHLPVPQIETPSSWASSLTAPHCTSSPATTGIGRRATTLVKEGKIPCSGHGPKGRDRPGLSELARPLRTVCTVLFYNFYSYLFNSNSKFSLNFWKL
jgi:hypothetical protein